MLKLVVFLPMFFPFIFAFISNISVMIINISNHVSWCVLFSLFLWSDLESKMANEVLIKKCDKRYLNIDRKCDVAYNSIHENCSILHQSLASTILKAEKRVENRCDLISKEECFVLKKKFIDQQYQDFLKVENRCRKSLGKVDESCKPALKRTDKLCKSIYRNVGCQ